MPEAVGRRPYVAGNWKMHKTAAEARAFVEELLPLIADAEGVEVGVCAPFTALAAAVEAAAGSDLIVAAQNMHDEDEGAFTGEVSAPMLREVGVRGVILGHSERRELFGETNDALSRKVPAALDTGLEPILCIGETDSEHEAGETEAKLRRQVGADLAGVPDERLAEVVIAYEPIWAIGTGKVATPDQAQDAIAFVRALLADRSAEAAASVRILYGGSVKPDNAAELMAEADVDGALVGGASLEPASLAAIVAAAAGG